MTALENSYAVSKERGSSRAQSRSATRTTEHRPALRAVPIRDDRAVEAPTVPLRRPVVRPDRPASRRRGLSFVPSAATPAQVEVPLGEWKLEDARSYRHSGQVRRIAESSSRAHKQQQTSNPARRHLSNVARPINTVSASPQLIATRAILGVVVVLGVVLAGFVFGTLIGLAPEAGSVITVQAGQTLEQIAASVPGGESINAVIDDILSLNVVDHGAIFAGQELVLPKY